METQQTQPHKTLHPVFQTTLPVRGCKQLHQDLWQSSSKLSNHSPREGMKTQVPHFLLELRS